MIPTLGRMDSSARDKQTRANTISSEGFTKGDVMLTENNNLLAHTRHMPSFRPPSKNHIPSKQASKKRIICALLPWLRAHVLQKQHRRLVYRRIFRQILGMCPRRAENELQFFLHGAWPEQEYHTKPNLSAIFLDVGWKSSAYTIACGNLTLAP